MKPNFHKEHCGNSVTHHIVTNDSPVHAKPRRLTPDKLKYANEEFRQMMQLGIICSLK